MTRAAVPAPPPEPRSTPASRPGPAPRARILPARSGARVFGLTGEARLERSLDKLGVPWTTEAASPPHAGAGATVLLRADWVYDERLVSALCEAPGCLLLDRAGRPVAAHVPDGEAEGAGRALVDAPGAAATGAWRRVGPDDLVPPYSHELRKHAPALLERLGDATARTLERRLFDASYKGITDLVTFYVWPPLALPAVRACARLGISPNAITVASWLLVALACVAFARGRFAEGLVVAWLMTFLDTVDGKLARVTLRSSRIGHVLDHGLDILHPPFWWAAWGLALHGVAWAPAATWVAVVGYWLHRGVEGLFLALFGIEIHAWRRIDARFRLITTRRNPNLILLTVGVAFGRPELGFAALAAWTVLSIAFHAVRIVQAGLEARRGRPIRSEYEETAAAAGWPEAAR